MMPVHATVRQLHLRPQRLLENFPLQPANPPVLFRQLLIRTIVLTQNRQATIGTNFNVITPAQQGVPQPPPAVLQLSIAEAAQTGDQRVANAGSDRLSNGSIRNASDFAPQDQRQVTVVVSQLPEPLLSDAIDIMRAPAPRTDEIATDESIPLQS